MQLIDSNSILNYYAVDIASANVLFIVTYDSLYNHSRTPLKKWVLTSVSVLQSSRIHS